jgi:hypothetical protein
LKLKLLFLCLCEEGILGLKMYVKSTIAKVKYKYNNNKNDTNTSTSTSVDADAMIGVT